MHGTRALLVTASSQTEQRPPDTGKTPRFSTSIMKSNTH